MSLNFELKHIANWETLCKDPRDGTSLSPVTNALIWACLKVELRGITEENADEFFWRLRWFQRLDGPDFQWNDGASCCITLQDVKDHIGLRTNVSEKKRKDWLKRFETENHPPAAQEQSATEYMIGRAKVQRASAERLKNVAPGVR